MSFQAKSRALQQESVFVCEGHVQRKDSGALLLALRSGDLQPHTSYTKHLHRCTTSRICDVVVKDSAP